MNVNDLQLQELRRFAELGRLSATMIHEISNPLSAAMLQLELSDNTSPAVRRARRSMRVLQRYVEAARQQIRAGGQTKVFLLQPQLDQLKRLILPMARQTGVGLEFGAAPCGCKLRGDPIKFQQIMANLITNAVQAYDKPGQRRQNPRVKVNLLNDGDWLVIRVQDWGKGVAAADVPKLFELFYTTKNDRDQGLGIGLAIVNQAVTDFQGTIEVKSARHGGTQFIVKLPRHDF